jgi:RNA polymerase sigma-70 factor (family 1)
MAEDSNHILGNKQQKSYESNIAKLSDGNNVLDSETLIRHAFNLDAQKGYELLFRRYYKALCSHAVRFVYSKEIAEDIVSDAFLQFWKNQSYQNISTSFRAYLYASVRNRAINYLKWEFKNEISLDQNDLNQSYSASPIQILQYDELFNEIEKCVSNFAPQCQKVFLLSRFENKKNKEIAEELGIALKTVETHMTKALNILKKTLKNYLSIIFVLLFSF